jgi:hypothetical protein
MKFAFLAAAAAAAVIATPAAAKDSESYKLALSGSVVSNCELVPEGSGTANVNMLDQGNQLALVIAYSCNSPYTMSLASKNGGMRHAESNGSVNIDYDVEAQGIFGSNQTSTNSVAMKNAPVVIVTNSDWQNILTNGGLRTGNLDLSFDSLNEYAVAGTYSDELTITLAANY